jgi:hypothetical protein
LEVVTRLSGAGDCVAATSSLVQPQLHRRCAPAGNLVWRLDM